MKHVLLVTDGIFHPPLLARMSLGKTLAKLDGLAFQHSRSLERLPENLARYSALVIYFHHKVLSDSALAALDRFVSHGGGVLGIHSATASFKEQREYHKILGGRFVGHGKVEPFTVRPVSGSDLFAGIPAFTVRDELYLHELQPGIETHFTTEYQDRETPAVWTYRYGRGRVCYAVPGHCAGSMRNATYQEILRRGLIWVCEK